MHYLLVLAMLAFSAEAEVLYNKERAMEMDAMEDALEDERIMPKKDLMWEKKEVEKKVIRSEPPSYMFHMLKKFSKEGRRGFFRSILPTKGGHLTSFFYIYYTFI